MIERVKKTRFMEIHRWPRVLQRWISANLPANDRAAIAFSANRWKPKRVRLRRGRTLIEIVLLVDWPVTRTVERANLGPDDGVERTICRRLDRTVAEVCA